MPPEKDIFRVFLVVSCFIISVVKNNQIEKYFCRKLHLNLGEAQKNFYLHISNIFVKNTKTLKNPIGGCIIIIIIISNHNYTVLVRMQFDTLESTIMLIRILISVMDKAPPVP